MRETKEVFFGRDSCRVVSLNLPCTANTLTSNVGLTALFIALGLIKLLHSNKSVLIVPVH